MKNQFLKRSDHIVSVTDRQRQRLNGIQKIQRSVIDERVRIILLRRKVLADLTIKL